jgi:hypothetical protein
LVDTKHKCQRKSEREKNAGQEDQVTEKVLAGDARKWRQILSKFS